MSDEAAITITLKAGPGHDDPWIVIRADRPDTAVAMLQNTGGLEQAVIEASNTFKAVKNAGPLLGAAGSGGTEATSPAAVTPGPWPGSPAPAAPQANFQQAAQPGGHPEGRQCNACGSILVSAQTRTGRSQWKCPQHRSVKNGDGSWGDNGHTMEWAR